MDDGSAARDGGRQVSWHGRHFEDFQVGDVYRHPLYRRGHGPDVTAVTPVWDVRARRALGGRR
ncbi:hypothetical protein AB0M95_07600 [Sphaerisporangium sp. NPDC051017]|uniref:hypothetical protein n=1 Tax=Sphaerisporangium sp. NPDC051017 TaxID=3154636 RepID=UPI00341B0625